MIFEWDHSKSEKNRRERGFSFSYAIGIFEDEIIAAIDERHDYGEVRMKALGAISDRGFVVVFTDRAPNLRRIISARPAATRELLVWRQFVGL